MSYVCLNKNICSSVGLSKLASVPAGGAVAAPAAGGAAGGADAPAAGMLKSLIFWLKLNIISVSVGLWFVNALYIFALRCQHNAIVIGAAKYCVCIVDICVYVCFPAEEKKEEKKEESEESDEDMGFGLFD